VTVEDQDERVSIPAWRLRLVRAVGILLLIGVVAAVAYTWLRSDPFHLGLDQEAYYDSAAQALAGDAVARGWIPPWLPRSAKAIRESHNLDTNQAWLEFTVDDPGELDGMLLHCASLPAEQVPLPADRDFRGTPWWPDDLAADRGFPGDAYEFFVYSTRNGDPAFLAVDRARARVWHWLP
jgi:hypothetical protein